MNGQMDSFLSGSGSFGDLGEKLMLILIAASSSLFGPNSITCVDDRYAAEVLLGAILENAVVVTTEKNFANALSNCIKKLPVKLGQQLAIRAAELSKVANRAIRVSQKYATPFSVSEELLFLGNDGADAIVCSSDQLATITNTAPKSTSFEICVLAEYPQSKAEATRKGFLQAVDLKPISLVNVQAIFKRAVMGVGKIIVADKMFGVAAKDGNVSKKLEKFARGVVVIAESARVSGKSAEIEVISVAGMAGARSGYIDPVGARSAIEKAIRNVDNLGCIGNLQVTLKIDNDPPIFRDRFLAAGDRCWGVRHGFDDIGAHSFDPQNRSPTYIDPDCSANRNLLSLIKNLKDA